MTVRLQMMVINLFPSSRSLSTTKQLLISAIGTRLQTYINNIQIHHHIYSCEQPEDIHHHLHLLLSCRFHVGQVLWVWSLQMSGDGEGFVLTKTF